MNFMPYEGNEPYIFVSYAHANQEIVTRIIETLHENGYRIWYDSGIMPGDDPFENIAKHLYNSALVIVFLSRRSIQSHYCKSEVNFAFSKSKNLICVVLEEFEMPLGWEMQLQNTQLLFYYKLSEEEFYAKLLGGDNIKKVQKGDKEDDFSPSAAARSLGREEADLLPVTEGAVFIPDDVTEICAGAFEGREDIRRAVLGKNVKKIGERAFANCCSLEKISFGERLAQIGPQAFSRCRALEEVESFSPRFEWLNGRFLIEGGKALIGAFPKCGETECVLPISLRYIEPYAFDGVTGMERLVISEGTVYIGRHAVRECEGLQVITLPYSVRFIAENAFSACAEIKFYGHADSYGERYCRTNGLRFSVQDEIGEELRSE